MSSSLTGLSIVFSSIWKHAVVKITQINPTTSSLETNFGRSVAESKFYLFRSFRRQQVTSPSNYSFKFEIWMCLYFNKHNWLHRPFVCILKRNFPSNKFYCAASRQSSSSLKGMNMLETLSFHPPNHLPSPESLPPPCAKRIFWFLSLKVFLFGFNGENKHAGSDFSLSAFHCLHHLPPA